MFPYSAMLSSFWQRPHLAGLIALQVESHREQRWTCRTSVRPAGIHHPAIDLASQRAATVVGPGEGTVPRTPDHRAARRRQNDDRRLPQGAWAGCHRHETEHGRRDLLVRPPAHARELGHLKGSAHDRSGRRSPGKKRLILFSGFTPSGCRSPRTTARSGLPWSRSATSAGSWRWPASSGSRTATTWPCSTTTGGSSGARARRPSSLSTRRPRRTVA